jgi:hypothetical protein
MKQLIVFILLICTINLFADTPGKATMHDSKISFQNVTNTSHTTFYWQMENAKEVSMLTSDTSFFMSASRGAPVEYKFWGINSHVSPPMSTDTISFHNYYSPDYVIIINSIEGRKINYTKKELSNKNEILSEGNTDDIANKDLIKDAKKAKQNHYLKICVFIGIGIIALLAIVWYVKKRKKQSSV